jgi:hypothetical protein
MLLWNDNKSVNKINDEKNFGIRKWSQRFNGITNIICVSI